MARIERSFSASFEDIAEVTGFVESFFEQEEIPIKILMKMNIAVDEIYSNIAKYSRANSSTVMCSAEEGKLMLVFKDNGIEYDPTKMPEPDTTLSAEEREIGGLGIFLIRQIMDEVKYERINNQNILTIKKNL